MRIRITEFVRVVVYIHSVDDPFHFISDDQSHGGHVLGVAGKQIEAEVEHLDDFRIALPETEAFLASNLNFDPTAILDKVERSS